MWLWRYCVLDGLRSSWVQTTVLIQFISGFQVKIQGNHGNLYLKVIIKNNGSPFGENYCHYFANVNLFVNVFFMLWPKFSKAEVRSGVPFLLCHGPAFSEHVNSSVFSCSASVWMEQWLYEQRYSNVSKSPTNSLKLGLQIAMWEPRRLYYPTHGLYFFFPINELKTLS